MLSDCQLKITDDYNIYNGNDKKLIPSLFDKEKYVLHYRLATLCKHRIQNKRSIKCIKIWSIKMAKTIHRN